ncbi:methyltransferase [Aestuariibius insulae]|uniref:methyltransferase n=1 Tax=Aestuariibius insulae TaxID=2058287 RepID=UPI00398F639E
MGLSLKRPNPSTTFARLIANPGFQRWAARFPLTRRLARKDGEALFDLVSGFCHSQILQAFVALDLHTLLLDGPKSLDSLALQTKVSHDRLAILLQAAAALGLVKRKRKSYSLSRKGAALAGVPGLSEMILHHDILYRDLRDPVAFFKGESETELAELWPYVFGQNADLPKETADRYSALMSGSQALVAEDTLRAVTLSDVRCLMDVGGGRGAFLSEVARRYPDMELKLFDLPGVVSDVPLELSGVVDIHAGSFREDPLPEGADAISLIRVLYDHPDHIVSDLLTKVYEALPDGGRLIISEPMSGGDRPERPGDAYFAIYTLAMRTGRTRSAAEISDLCRAAGFTDIRIPKTARRFVTSCLTAVKLS